MIKKNKPLLSICIPTYNRPKELAEALRVLELEVKSLDVEMQARIEVIVSDNHSPKNAAVTVVTRYLSAPLNVDFIQQTENVGPTLNFEYCYRRAQGEYIIILSDDDYFTPGSLNIICDVLAQQNPDILFLPIHSKKTFSDVVKKYERNEFLIQLGYLPTLVSSCILKQSLIRPVLGRYLDTNLHHFFYFLTALEQGERFFYLERQVLYCPYEDNSGGYNWFVAFADDLPKILREFPGNRIQRSAISQVRSHLLTRQITPVFVNRQVKGHIINGKYVDISTWSIIKLLFRHFSDQPLFWFFLLPFSLVPQPLCRAMMQLYKWQKGRFFQWHPT